MCELAQWSNFGTTIKKLEKGHTQTSPRAKVSLLSEIEWAVTAKILFYVTSLKTFFGSNYEYKNLLSLFTTGVQMMHVSRNNDFLDPILSTS